MFRALRRNNRALEKEDCENILHSAVSGVLAVNGDDGYPYAVPLNFVYDKGIIYFHCASEGHKIDSIKKDPKASFCVVSKDLVVPEKLTTEFESVIAFGKVYIVNDESEKMHSIKLLSEKYAPDIKSDEHIKKYWDALTMLAFKVEHMSGKKSK